MTNLCSHSISSALGTFHRWGVQTNLVKDSEAYGDVGLLGRKDAKMAPGSPPVLQTQYTESHIQTCAHIDTYISEILVSVLCCDRKS